MKAFVDKKACIFCGMCGGACPDVFRADYDGKSVSLDVELANELLVEVEHAKSICPAWAITIQDVPANAIMDA